MTTHSFTSRRPMAVVTGASNGIGRAIASELAAKGHDVVLVARSATRLKELVEELTKRHGIRAEAVALDLAEPDSADQLAALLQSRGVIPQVLVNNAGFGLFGTHVETDLQDEQQMIDLNITTLTRLTKLLLPMMVARREGRILNVASTAAFQPGPYMAVYYATKAYVLSYSEALAEELADTGVTVTALCPGPTASGFQDRAAMQDSALVRGKRLPTAEAVARYGVNAALKGRRVAIPGLMNKLMAQSIRVTPRRVVTRLVARMSRPMNPPATTRPA